MNIFKSLMLIILCLQFVGCKDDEPGALKYSYHQPEMINDGISTGDAAIEGLNVKLLEEMVNLNKDGSFVNVHSILVAKKGKLIFEEYFQGKPIYGNTQNWDMNRLHNMHSVSKSFTSALIGLAIERDGLSLQDRIIDYFPELDSIVWVNGKDAITLEDLITMSSGLKWDEWTYSYDDPRNDHRAMYESNNWVHFVLEKPLVYHPGSRFVYNSGLTITLGEVIFRKTGKKVNKYAEEHLFGPLGITGYKWSSGNANIFQTGGGLSVSSRSMMKFGLLFCNGGVWNGNRVISEEWIKVSTSQHGPNPSYGYHWWRSSYRVGSKLYQAYLAAGRGGQYIIIIPVLDVVVVFTAGNDNSLGSEQSRELMIKYILPAFQ